MLRFKLVDGEEIPLTDEEIAELESGALPEITGPTQAELTPSRLQLRYTLADAKVLEAWENAVAVSSLKSRIYWEDKQYPQITNPKMVRWAAAVGVDLTALYELAKTR